MYKWVLSSQFEPVCAFVYGNAFTKVTDEYPAPGTYVLHLLRMTMCSAAVNRLSLKLTLGSESEECCRAGIAVRPVAIDMTPHLITKISIVSAERACRALRVSGQALMLWLYPSRGPTSQGPASRELALSHLPAAPSRLSTQMETHLPLLPPRWTRLDPKPQIPKPQLLSPQPLGQLLYLTLHSILCLVMQQVLCLILDLTLIKIRMR